MTVAISGTLLQFLNLADIGIRTAGAGGAGIVLFSQTQYPDRHPQQGSEDDDCHNGKLNEFIFLHPSSFLKPWAPYFFSPLEVAE